MDKRQQDLAKIIYELSTVSNVITEAKLKNYISRLKAIYTDDFRHYYSEIFGTMTVVKNDDKYDLEVLIGNIDRLFRRIETLYAKDSNEEKFFSNSKKLYDHINLDKARFEYISDLANDLEGKIKKNNEELQKKMQRDYVTILGIFAAVIIAFVSGMAFSTSVLNNIGSVSIYHLSFVTILIAFLLFNLLNLLLDFLLKINKFHTNDGNSLIKRINKVLFWALIIDVLLWIYYWWRMSYPDSCINIFS